MTAIENINSNPAAPAAMLAVDRAVHEFRRGRPVSICDDVGNSIIALASEVSTAQAIARLSELSCTEPSIAITHHRARTL